VVGGGVGLVGVVSAGRRVCAAYTTVCDVSG